jgi:SpoVK/Ycf46/Vps4 family AAA+-type ATPase
MSQAPLAGDWRYFRLTNLDRHQRRAYWQQALQRANIQLSDPEFDTLTDRFNLTPAQIDRTLAQAEPTLTSLLAAARQQSDQTLGKVAQKLFPKYKWADIILPPAPLAQLQEIGNQARMRSLVYEQWGFDRKLSLGKGLNILFAGPPGTGKTMAAEVIANDLQLDLYKIDLSQVVSKYIGETEKNLDRIFTAAHSANAILFFDEADALFGKRSEVKDAHDRYANIEVGYLLQKMEEYEGTAILATNLRQNMDDAFVRRLQVIVEFPFPDQEFRRQIWRVMVPPELPIERAIDFDWLAQEIKLPGGNIKNIVLAAAFLAASDGQVVTMNHLIQASEREYQKLGRSWVANSI